MNARFFKKEEIRYLSFEEYAKRNRVRYNRKSFIEEDMYFCRMWKAHRQNYNMMCKTLNCASDTVKFNERLENFEARLNNNR